MGEGVENLTEVLRHALIVDTPPFLAPLRTYLKTYVSPTPHRGRGVKLRGSKKLSRSSDTL